MARLTDPQRFEAALKHVDDEGSFIQKLLVEALEWPIQDRVTDVEEITYRWSKAELRAADLDEKLVDGQVRQIANLDPSQPWGIFILEFRHPDAFLAERGMTGTLRKVLRGLVPSRRKESVHASWEREHLLFICTHQYKHFRLAYFKAPAGSTKTAPLAAFGWGPDIPARTACEFNLPALKWPGDASDHPAWVSEWAAAFDVAKVTRRFYEEYKAEFEELQNAVTPLAGEDRKMFAQSLMNRLLFLRFVERKNWFEFPAGKNTKTYLRDLFAAGGMGRKSFYSSRLQPLFFEGLAIEGRQESDAIGRVHFLNGGLFEQSEFDKKVSNIPNEAFAPIIGPDGLFYRYNFTVEESTPLDIEVAVDPEMLGKVFEELVTGRHESGSYYTPRPIVAFMCREALKGYLQDKTTAAADSIASLVDRHEVTGLTEAHGQQIRHALDSLKAVDPACGSGAYLLGLMHELIALYRLLQNEKLVPDPRSLYDLKLRIISHNLYGVDIDPFATNIAMLRLWLSLAVDSDDPLPLPNLDFKIETGDSLTGPDPSAMPDLFREKLQREADSLVRRKDRYLNCHDNSKYDMAAEIELKQELIARTLHTTVGHGVIDWRIHFADVFGTAGGFDIVLANPPYLDSETMTKNDSAMREAIKNSYSMTKGNWDIYIAFFEMGFRLLTRTGILCFITPDKWLAKPFGDALRSTTVSKIECILNLGRSIFQSSNVDAIVSIFLQISQPRLRVLEAVGPSIITKRVVEKSTLKAPFAYDWLFSDLADLLAKIETGKDRLVKYGVCENSCATSDAYKLKILVQERPSSSPPGKHFLRVINTGTIGKYTSKWGQREMVYLGNRYMRPVVDKNVFLRTFPNSYGKKSVKSKLIVKGLNLLDACIDEEGSTVPGKTTLVITAGDIETLKFLLAVVNSRVGFTYLKQRYPAFSYNQGTTFTKEMINDLPIPVISAGDKSTITGHVDRILQSKRHAPAADTAALEAVLEDLLYKLYGLSEADIAKVKGLVR